MTDVVVGRVLDAVADAFGGFYVAAADSTVWPSHWLTSAGRWQAGRAAAGMRSPTGTRRCAGCSRWSGTGSSSSTSSRTSADPARRGQVQVDDPGRPRRVLSLGEAKWDKASGMRPAYGLLESALARPQATVFGKDAYPALDSKTAVQTARSRRCRLSDGISRAAWIAE